MPNIDIIELALSSPIDWEKFEAIVHDILVEDGLPQLRRLGGRDDHGLDAYSEAFYAHKSARLEIAVQITSQKTQKAKFADTIKKLKEHKIEPQNIIMVFRDECASATVRSIKEAGEKAGFYVEVRDRTYIAQQLGKNNSIFARHLGGDIRSQVDRLLERKDPLDLAHDELKRSVLASVSAYSLNRHSKLIKGKLFERTVLAVIAASEEIEKEEILERVTPLFPGETIDSSQISSALESLQATKEITHNKKKYKASSETLATVARVLLSIESAHKDLLDWVTNSIRPTEAISDATQGYIEKNIRDAVTLLVRLIAPFENGESKKLDSSSEKELGKILYRNVPPDIGRKSLVAIAGYVEDKSRRAKLAPFIRAYTTLAIRNLDPIGRQWQAEVLNRSIVTLDTDAALKLLIEDLPEQKLIKLAINGLAKEGVKIIIPNHVLLETLDHIERAYRTHNKFKDSIERLPLSVVDSKVWHAVVRGYAYALKERQNLLWNDYYARYHDNDEPIEYLIKLFNKRAPITIEDLHDIPDSDMDDFASLSSILEQREQSRLKADYRGESHMHDRVESDLRMLFNMAERQSSSLYKAKGYLVSEDTALFHAERSNEWGKRPKIMMMTRTLPELASFICGTELDDSDVVRLVFEPLLAATAELMSDEIDTLSRAGADLSDETLDQIEWKLEKGLRKSIHNFSISAESGELEQIEEASLTLIEEADRVGFKLVEGVSEAAKNYRSLSKTAAQDKAELARLQAAIKDALYEVAGESSKGRARANRVIEALQVNLKNR